MCYQRMKLAQNLKHKRSKLYKLWSKSEINSEDGSNNLITPLKCIKNK
jgi:hypothetical protein